MTIATPTVLVLGAASSAHCGYPLGMQLISQIVNAQRSGSGIPLPTCWEKAHVDQLVNRLSRAAHSSIDAFLETVPAEVDLGKYLITYCLKQNENVDSLFPPHQSGWYQYLFNSLLGPSGEPFANNCFTVVTYNYDRSLEAYLYHALIARLGITETEALAALRKIPIIHVHGMLGRFPETLYETINDVDSIRDISTGINIIHEIRDSPNDFCSNEFRDANAAISEAEKVIFLGFGFHRDNVRRLKVNWTSRPSRQVLSTFWDTSPEEYNRLMSRLGEFGISRDMLRNTYGGPCESFFRHVTSLE